MLVWFLIVFLVLYFLFHLAYIFFQPKFIFRPKKLPPDFQFTCHAPLQEINLVASDGINLNGVLISSPHKKGIVLYFHGNMMHLQNYLPYTAKFTELGYSVFIPDYRGFGKSNGTLSEQNFYDDALLMFDWLRQSFPLQKIIVYGRSLGTGAAVYIAAHRACDQLILEASFCNMYDVARWYGLLLPTGNYLQFELRTDLLLMKVKCPVALFHGTKDRTIPLRSSKKLKQLLKPDDLYCEIKNGNHNNLEQFTIYHEELEQLLN
jgi:fermentation-respiration switch protein FrsA (DUF1100 family)